MGISVSKLLLAIFSLSTLLLRAPSAGPSLVRTDSDGRTLEEISWSRVCGGRMVALIYTLHSRATKSGKGGWSELRALDGRQFRHAIRNCTVSCGSSVRHVSRRDALSSNSGVTEAVKGEVLLEDYGSLSTS